MAVVIAKADAAIRMRVSFVMDKSLLVAFRFFFNVAMHPVRGTGFVYSGLPCSLVGQTGGFLGMSGHRHAMQHLSGPQNPRHLIRVVGP